MTKQFKVLRSSGLALLALLYLWPGAIDKLLAWNQTVHYMGTQGWPWPSLFVAGALCLEIVAPLALFNSRFRAPAFMILAIYTLATGLLFHDFWRADGPDHAQFQNFFKNLALTGALFYMYAMERMSTVANTRAAIPHVAVMSARPYRT